MLLNSNGQNDCLLTVRQLTGRWFVWKNRDGQTNNRWVSGKNRIVLTNQNFELQDCPIKTNRIIWVFSLKGDPTNPFQPTPPIFSCIPHARTTDQQAQTVVQNHGPIQARHHVPRVEGLIRLQGYSTTLLKEPLRAPVRGLASERDREVRTPASVVTLGDTGSAAIFKKERSRGIEIAKVG